ncbi:MAG: GNAT family N-acetyltransferase [Bacteroidota bacterium]
MTFQVVISTEPSLLDIDLIYEYLSRQSYWAKGRSRAMVERSIEHSFCFGMYLDNRQIGFARVVSDFTIFGWLMDVFILPEFRGKGYGKQLLTAVFSQPSLQHLKRWGLNTNDAHGLYEQFGFKTVKDSSIYMERLAPS